MLEATVELYALNLPFLLKIQAHLHDSFLTKRRLCYGCQYDNVPLMLINACMYTYMCDYAYIHTIQCTMRESVLHTKPVHTHTEMLMAMIYIYIYIYIYILLTQPLNLNKHRLKPIYVASFTCYGGCTNAHNLSACFDIGAQGVGWVPYRLWKKPHASFRQCHGAFSFILPSWFQAVLSGIGTRVADWQLLEFSFWQRWTRARNNCHDYCTAQRSAESVLFCWHNWKIRVFRGEETDLIMCRESWYRGNV